MPSCRRGASAACCYLPGILLERRPSLVSCSNFVFYCIRLYQCCVYFRVGRQKSRRWRVANWYLPYCDMIILTYYHISISVRDLFINRTSEHEYICCFFPILVCWCLWCLIYWCLGCWWIGVGEVAGRYRTVLWPGKAVYTECLFVCATDCRGHPNRHSRYGIPYGKYPVLLWQSGVVRWICTASYFSNMQPRQTAMLFFRLHSTFSSSASKYHYVPKIKKRSD